MKKKILAVVFLIIIVLECFVIYNKEKKVTTKDEIEEKEQINKENLITIIDILNDFEKNPSINLISIDDKVENYEVNIKIVENKKEFIETISKLNNFKIVDYNIKLEENNIHRFELFKEKFNCYVNKTVDENFLIDYIKLGDFFKNSPSSKKYIFFNGIDEENYLEKFSLTLEVCNQLKKDNSSYNFVLGSIHNNYIFKYIPTDAIVMASGYSKRMGKNKLQLPYRDTNLLGYTLEKLSFLPFYNIYVCGREDWIESLAKKFNYIYLENKNAHLGQSESVKLGVNNSSGEGIVFFTGDQPLLTKNNILKIYFEFLKYNYITIPRAEGERFSPVFFPKDKRKELLNLEGDTGGREVIKNSSLISFVDFPNKIEFLDIDTPEEYQNIISL